MGADLKPTEPSDIDGPDLFAEIEGEGTKVTTIFDWPGCDKAVFHWAVEPGNSDRASLTLDLHELDGDNDVNLVTMDVRTSEEVTGSAF